MMFGRNKQGIRWILAGCLALALSACSGASSSTLGDAEDAFEQNQFRVARIHLLNVLKEDSRNPKSNLLYAKLMLELGDGLAAENALGKLSDGDIDSVERMEMLAHSYIMQGHPDKAQRILDDLGKEKWTAQAYRMALWALMEQGRLAPEDGLLEDALLRHKDSADIQAIAANFAMQRGFWDIAEEHAEKAVASDPENYEALIANGRVEIFKGDFLAARGFYERASKAYPDHAVPIANMAGLDLDLGDQKSAEAVIEKGLAKHPKFPFLLFQKARLLFMAGKYRESNDTLLAMKGGLDNFVPALILSGRVARKLGNGEYATAKFNRALFVEPGNSEAEELLRKAR